jgi:threonine/homoserine/homoserine lactone efflux protein
MLRDKKKHKLTKTQSSFSSFLFSLLTCLPACPFVCTYGYVYICKCSYNMLLEKKKTKKKQNKNKTKQSSFSSFLFSLLTCLPACFFVCTYGYVYICESGYNMLLEKKQNKNKTKQSSFSSFLFSLLTCPSPLPFFFSFFSPFFPPCLLTAWAGLGPGYTRGSGRVLQGRFSRAGSGQVLQGRFGAGSPGQVPDRIRG